MLWHARFCYARCRSPAVAVVPMATKLGVLFKSKDAKLAKVRQGLRQQIDPSLSKSFSLSRCPHMIRCVFAGQRMAFGVPLITELAQLMSTRKRIWSRRWRPRNRSASGRHQAYERYLRLVFVEKGPSAFPASLHWLELGAADKASHWWRFRRARLWVRVRRRWRLSTRSVTAELWVGFMI